MCPNQNFGLMLAIVSMCPINIGVQIDRVRMQSFGSVLEAGHNASSLGLKRKEKKRKAHNQR